MVSAIRLNLIKCGIATDLIVMTCPCLDLRLAIIMAKFTL